MLYATRTAQGWNDGNLSDSSSEEQPAGYRQTVLGIASPSDPATPAQPACRRSRLLPPRQRPPAAAAGPPQTGFQATANDPGPPRERPRRYILASRFKQVGHKVCFSAIAGRLQGRFHSCCFRASYLKNLDCTLQFHPACNTGRNYSCSSTWW